MCYTNNPWAVFSQKHPPSGKAFRLLPLVLCLSQSAWAADYVEFNTTFLQAEAKNMDISRFNRGSYLVAGEYLADVQLNDTFKGSVQIRVVEDPTTKESVVCASETLYTLLDLKSEAIVDTTPIQQDCHSLSKSVPQADISLDSHDLKLFVTIPQALIKQRPRGYISPAQWQDGVPVAFARYDASTYRYSYNKQSSYHSYLGLDTGVNLFGWAFRHRGSKFWTPGIKSSYQAISTYAQRDIAPLRAQLTLGDFYTSGNLVESFGLRGVQLSSDDRMLPSSVRNYAPTVRGVANTNATVTVRQNGQILREVNVPPGAFEINDLYPIGYAGDLEVEITEANGQKRTFSVPYTASVQLIRPGYSRYQFAVGRFRYGNKIYDEKVAQATFQYGLTNSLTLNLGGTYTKNYHAELLGLALNTPIGAFSGNATLSHAKLINKEKVKGHSLSLNYNTRISPTNTNITLAAYRYSSRNFYSLQGIISHHNSQFNRALQALHINAYRPKHQFQATISQQLKEGWGNLYLTGSSYTYWNSAMREHQYQIGYSNSYKRINYNLSFSQSKNSFNEKENFVFFSVSIPLGKESSYHTLSQSIDHSSRNGYAARTSLSGTLGNAYQYSYSLSASKQQHNTTQLSAAGQYYGSRAQVGASWYRDNKNNQQTSFSLSGAVVAHPKGVTFTNGLNDTFAIIHAKGAAGATIHGSPNNKIDMWGNGIVPYLDPYNINYINIDTSELPASVELSATEQQVIPRANSAILVNFSTTIGNVVFFELKNVDLLPPLGTEVFNEKQESVGVVAQGGRIYTRGIAEKGKLHLSWENRSCSFEYQLPEVDAHSTTIIPVDCQ